MTSFVTGATGFIGQRLLVGLEANWNGVRILSRNPHPDYETVVCDLQSETIPEDGLAENFKWFGNNWNEVQLSADFPAGMSSAVRK